MKASTKLLPQALLILALVTGALGLGLPIESAIAKPALQTTNLALNKPAICSPTPQFPCAEAFDGSLTTRWASAQGVDPQWIYVDLGASYNISHVKLTWETAYGKSYQIQTSPDAATWRSDEGVDPQWIYVDLGASYNISHVKLTWETAYGKSYQIQTSPDAATWASIYTTTTGDGGVDDLTGLTGSGRYIRMNGTVRGTGWGYSLWEFEVYAGTGGPTNTPTWTATAPAITNT